MSGGWWPYGELADQLADAVLAGDMDLAGSIAKDVKTEKAKRARYDDIIRLFCLEMEACRWDNAEQLLEKARQVGQVAAHDITYYDTMYHFEKSEVSVLDRLVEKKDDGAEVS